MLHLYLIRHAEAVPHGDPNYADDDRPLTDAGKAEARRLGAALAAHAIRFDALLCSPLPRARQTAEELVQGLGSPTPAIEYVDELAPGTKSRKLDRLLVKTDGAVIAVVGHEPDLGEYAARLIGSKKVSVTLEKPGVACIACEDPPGKGCGSLTLLITPAWFGAPVKPASAIAEEPPLYAAPQANGGSDRMT